MRTTASLKALPFALILVGCPRIDFETDTVVHDDGSVTRTTHYVATDEARSELRSLYVLPEGGVWESRTERKTDDDGEVTETLIDTYTVTAHYKPGADITSDHVRQGKPKGRALRNTIALSTTNYVVLKFFDYREVYGDDIGRELARTTVEAMYPLWTDDVAERLANGLEGVSVDEARDVIRELSDPWVQKFLDGVFIPQLFSEDGNDASVEAFVARLPETSNADTDEGREIIDDALDESLEAFLEREDVNEAFFGVYDFTFSRSYSLDQSLTMPGDILSTNADSIAVSTLTWELDQERLVFYDQALEARSRVVYFDRIAWAGLAAVALLLAGWWRQQSGRAGSPST